MQDFRTGYAAFQKVVMGGDIPDIYTPVDDTSNPGEEVAGTVFQQKFFISLLKEIQTLLWKGNGSELKSSDDDETDQIHNAISGMIATNIDPFRGNTIPVGGMVPYMGSVVPEEFGDSWGFCDGSSFDTQKYSTLQSVLATSGAVSDSNVPDMRGRAFIGATTTPVEGRKNFPFGSSSDKSTETMTEEKTFPHKHKFTQATTGGSSSGDYIAEKAIDSDGATDFSVSDNSVTDTLTGTLQIGMETFGGVEGAPTPLDIVGPHIAGNWLIRMK